MIGVILEFKYITDLLGVFQLFSVPCCYYNFIRIIQTKVPDKNPFSGIMKIDFIKNDDIKI